MLRDDEPVRVFHNHMKKAMLLHDMIVLGVVNDLHPDGIFNVATLGRGYNTYSIGQDQYRYGSL